jgi:hypothetical protein
MHVLLRGAQSGTSRRCRRGRYNSGIGPSEEDRALRCTELDHRSRRTALFSTLLERLLASHSGCHGRCDVLSGDVHELQHGARVPGGLQQARHDHRLQRDDPARR